MKAKIEDGILILKAENREEQKDLDYWMWLRDDDRVLQVVEVDNYEE